MFNISQYLQKFSRIEGETVGRENAIKSALSDVCGIEAPNFEIKKGMILIKAPQAAKSVIYMKKLAILAYLREKYPEVRVFDIR